MKLFLCCLLRASLRAVVWSMQRCTLKLELCNHQVPLNPKGSVTPQLSDVPEFLLNLHCCLTSTVTKKQYHGELVKDTHTATLV